MLVAWAAVRPFVDDKGQPTTIDPATIMSTNELLRHSERTPENNYFESNFLDLLKTHNIYMRCYNLGHYNSLGVRGESTIIKKIPVSSSFGYLILDSVVAQNDNKKCFKAINKNTSILLKRCSRQCN